MDSRRNREIPHNRWQALFLGAMMIVVGSTMCLLRLFPLTYEDTDIFVDDTTWGLIGRLLVIVGGIVIILLHRKGNYVAVGIYALTLGLSRIVRSVPGLFTDSDFDFYYALVFIVIGGNLAYGGYNHLTVRTRDPSTMRYVALMLMIIYLVVILFLYYTQMDIIYFVLNDIDVVGFIPLYIGLLLVVYSKEIMENKPMGRLSKFLTTVSFNMYAGDHIMISEEDLKRIEEGFSDTPSWDSFELDGVRVWENLIVMHTREGDKDVVLQKWSDSECLYLSLVNDRRDSFIMGSRLKATGYDVKNGVLRLLDREGVCAFIAIGGGY